MWHHPSLLPIIQTDLPTSLTTYLPTLPYPLNPTYPPTEYINTQGRARPAIAQLYAWRYKDLGNLPYVETNVAYRLANAGMAHDFQLIDVGDYQVSLLRSCYGRCARVGGWMDGRTDEHGSKVIDGRS